MIGWAEQHLLSGAKIQRAAILEVSNAFNGHTTLTVHRQIGRKEDPLAVAAKARLVLVAGIVRNEGFGLKVLENEPEQGFDVVFGIATNGFGM